MILLGLACVGVIALVMDASVLLDWGDEEDWRQYFLWYGLAFTAGVMGYWIVG